MKHKLLYDRKGIIKRWGYVSYGQHYFIARETLHDIYMSNITLRSVNMEAYHNVLVNSYG